MLATEGFWNVTQLMLSLIGGGFLSYFAIFTGINSAKQFGATEGLLTFEEIEAKLNAHPEYTYLIG